MEIGYIVLPEHDAHHLIGNKDCKEDWCGSHGYPELCKCGGLIHAAFGDENYDCEYWLYEECDRCGQNYEYKEERW